MQKTTIVHFHCSVFFLNRMTSVHKIASVLVLTLKVVVVALLFNVHGKHLRSCRDGQLT